MKYNRTVSLAAGHYGALVPFLSAAILFAGVAMQARLLPLKPIAIEFPPRADDTESPGALPEYSAPASQSPERNGVQNTVLPTEAVPDDQATSSALPSVALAAPDIAAPFGAAESSGSLPADSMKLGSGVPMGAGNLRIRTAQSHALSSLATNLMEQIKRLHPVPPQVRTKRPATIKAERPAADQAHSALAEAGEAGRAAGPGVGGPAPLKGVLGGPLPVAAKDAPVIDGTTFRRRF